MKLINTIVIWWLKTTGKFKGLPEDAIEYYGRWYVPITKYDYYSHCWSDQDTPIYSYHYQELSIDKYGQYIPENCWLSTNTPLSCEEKI